MPYKLNQRDKRALKLGLIVAFAIAAFIFGMNWLEHWGRVKASLAESRQRFSVVKRINDKFSELSEAVPVFEVPKKEQEQQYAFRSEFNNQLKKAGVQVKPMKFVTLSKSPSAQYDMLSLQCEGQANIDQILSLLDDLKNNPYFVAVEQFKIEKADTKNENSRDFKLNMEVSTFVRK